MMGFRVSILCIMGNQDCEMGKQDLGFRLKELGSQWGRFEGEEYDCQRRKEKREMEKV